MPRFVVFFFNCSTAVGSLLGLAEAQDAPPAGAQAPPRAEVPPRTQAGRAAEAFLVLVDKGKYQESYDAAATWFRKGITKRKWVDALTLSRKPLGRVVARKLDRVELRATANPDVPDQAWIYSKTQFGEGEPCDELTIVSIDEPGRWRMSGYFVGNPASFPKPPAPPPAAR